MYQLTCLPITFHMCLHELVTEIMPCSTSSFGKYDANVPSLKQDWSEVELADGVDQVLGSQKHKPDHDHDKNAEAHNDSIPCVQNIAHSALNVIISFTCVLRYQLSTLQQDFSKLMLSAQALCHRALVIQCYNSM